MSFAILLLQAPTYMWWLHEVIGMSFYFEIGGSFTPAQLYATLPHRSASIEALLNPVAEVDRTAPPEYPSPVALPESATAMHVEEEKREDEDESLAIILERVCFS